MTETNNFCRLCSVVVNDGDSVNIFGDDGKRRLLENKIKLYLHFLVSEDDDLPKNVCNICVRKLERTHRFASMAFCMQNRLRSRLGLHSLDSSEVLSPINILQVVYNEPREEKIIEKSDNEANREVTPADSECEVMEMELDPNLIFLEHEGYSIDDSEKPEVPQYSGGIDLMDGRHRGRTNNRNHLSVRKKPHVCIYCSRSFVLELSLRNHMWRHKEQHSKRSLQSWGSPTHVIRTPRSPSLIKPENYSKEMKAKLVPNANARDPAEKEVQEYKLRRETADTTKESSRENGLPSGEGLENNMCGICRESFVSQSELEAHREKHNLEGKFGCGICSRVFRSRGNLERHQFFHRIRERDYACNECGRVYSTQSTLRAHLVSHSNVRPHKCSLCPKTFKRNQDLKFHLNQHTGERPYMCPFCPKTFASSGNCFSHRKRMHPTEGQTPPTRPQAVDA